MSCSGHDGLVGGAGHRDRHRLRLKHGGKVAGEIFSRGGFDPVLENNSNVPK